MAQLQIPMTQLEQFSEAQKCGLASHFDEYRKSLDKAFRYAYSSNTRHCSWLTSRRNIRQITEKDDADGYFAAVMRPAYHKAQEIKGEAVFELPCQPSNTDSEQVRAPKTMC